MSVLVLGGAGYIGSHTVYALIEKGEDVVIVDNLQTGFKQLIHPKAKFYQGDLRDKEFLNSVFEKEDIKGVIHFAANSLVGVSMKEPLEYYNNNVYGMICLLEVMKEHGVKYIVFSSTAATYGEPKQIPITESDKTNPTNTYGETKLAMEKMMKWCDQAYGMKYVALRYFNACGAHENCLIGELHNPETHLIPLILQVPLKKRETIYVFGNAQGGADDDPGHDGRGNPEQGLRRQPVSIPDAAGNQKQMPRMPEARGANQRHAAHDGSPGGRAGGGWKAGGADCADAAKQAGGGIYGRRGG